MDTRSLWQELSQTANFPALDRDISVDVAVVGGGITGITIAMHLARAGKTVAVVEAHELGCSATGGSTGNLYATVDEHLYKLKEKWGEETAKTVVESRRASIELIGKLVADYRIDCQFSPRSWHLYTTAASAEQQEIVEQEYQAARQLGLEAKLVDMLPLPFEVKKAVRIENQAQINPLAYVRGLARAIASDTCHIFENSQVTAVEAKQGTVKTRNGRIKAGAIVLATHTPKGIHMVQTAMIPGREYGVAARLSDDNYPEGIFWSAGQPKHSIRSVEANGERYLLVVGRKHQTGKEAHTAACQEQLEGFVRSAFAVESVAFGWSAQNYRSADMLPYIGKSVIASGVYIATGYATDGLVYGTLAASIIADDIVGRSNPWRDVYKPGRFTPAKSARQFARQNIDVAKEYANRFFGSAAGDLDSIEPGQGKVIKAGGRKVAAYRDEQGKLTVVSATCTHLQCEVHWNEAEKSWDCPCHGSRFRYDGEVIEGPAIAPLARRA